MIFDKKMSSISPRLWMRSLRNDSLLRNSIYIMSSTTINAAVGSLYWIVAAHVYSTQDVGLASALLSVLVLAATLADLGISSTLVQTLPHRETGADWSLTLNAGSAAGTLAGLLAGSIIVGVLPLFSHQFAILWHSMAYALLLIIGVPLFTLAVLLDQTFVVERAARYMLLRNVAFALLKLLLIVMLVGVGALGIFSSFVLALVASVIGCGLLLIPRLGRSYRLAIRGIVGQARAMFSLLVGHHFINIGGIVPMYLLPVLVAARLSVADNAYYYTTEMMCSIFFMISPAVAMSLFVEGSHVANEVWRKAGFSALIIALLLGPAMLLSLLGGRYILLLFGPSYAQHALQLLIILTISAVPDAITNIYVSVLRVQGRLRYAALFSLGMALLIIVLAWILLLPLGIVGAGWAFLLSRLAGSLLAGIDIIISIRPGRQIFRQRRDSKTHTDFENSSEGVIINDGEQTTTDMRNRSGQAFPGRN